MSQHARRIARALEKQAGKTKTPGRTKLGVVASVTPYSITPMGGAIALPEEALIWSNNSLQTRTEWEVGDTVILSMVEDGLYIVHDVAATGTVIGGLGGTAGPHTHVISDVTGLQAALDGKAPLVHTHIIGDVIGLQAALDNRALVGHTHPFTDITGTITATQHGNLTAAGATTLHDWTQIGNKPTTFAPSAHTHVVGDIIAGTSDGTSRVLMSLNGTNSWAQITNAHVAAAAGIAYSKLTLTGSVVNADIAAAAAIAYSKLNLSASIVNADVAVGAAIAYSKLNLSGSIVNADVSASAAIAYSKLALASSIVNADIAAAAAIAVTKLALGSANTVLQSNGTTNSFAQITDAHVAAANKDGLTSVASMRTLGTGAQQAAAGNHTHAFGSITGTIAAGQYGAGSIVNADISGTAAIAYSKLALTGSIVNADVAAAAAIAYSKLNLTGAIVNADISASAAIAYSKLSLASSIVNADIAAAAAIAVTKLALGGANTVLQSNGTTNSFAQITDSHVATANKDGLAAVASMRTLGAGAQQAAAGNHLHTGVYSPVGHTHIIADVTGLQAALDLKAPLANPTFTGTVTAPTPALATDDGTVATMAVLHDAMDALTIGYTVYAVLPVGSEMSWPGAMAIPSGWLECDGSEKAIATYPDLYNRLTNNGTIFPFGANTNGSGGAGTTHFRLPNRKARVLVGQDTGNTNFDVIGETGGADTATLGVANLPDHVHSGTVTGAGLHSHSAQLNDHSHGGVSGTTADSNAGPVIPTTTGAQGVAWKNHTHAFSSGNTGNVAAFTGGWHGTGSILVDGGGTAGSHSHGFTGGSMTTGGTATGFSILQKYAVTRYIVKAVVVEDTPEWGDQSGRVTTTGTQSIADSPATPVIINTWATENHDVGNVWSAANPSRFTASEIGPFSLQGAIKFAASATASNRWVAWFKNGVLQDYLAQIPGVNSASLNTIVPFALSARLLPGDYVEIGVGQNSGGPLNIVAGSTVSFTREGYASGAGSQSQNIETTMTPTLVPTSGTSYAPDFTYTVIRVDSASTAKTVAMPTAVGNKGKRLIIKDGAGFADINNITIDPSGSETADGQATLVIDSAWAAISLVSDGTNWITETASSSGGGGGRNDFAFYMGLM